MLDFKFDQEATYLAACTFGPDSMALLGMMEECGVKPVVCFVNYHTNDSIEAEQVSMKEYCEKHGLVFECLDTANVSQEGREENFVLWARKTRYAFFEEQYTKHDASALFIAHTQDDLLESYLMAKKLGKKPDRYGFTMINSYHGMIVVRPLINFTKDDLLSYDKEHQIPYSEHMERFEDSIIRDKERLEVSQLNEIEREQILNEMAKENDQKITFMQNIAKDIQDSEILNIREIIALDKDEFASALIHFVGKYVPHINLTTKKLEEIRAMCLSPEPNMVYKLKGDSYLIKEYDVISVDSNPQELPYTYTIDKPCKFEAPYFDLDFTMGAEDRNIHDTDYPLTVRSALPGDEFIMNGYLFPVRRLFLDASMPQRLRHVWPVFLNKDGKIIYVPRYRKSFKEYHTSVLNIHVLEDEK
jgi:tRNA(Ile)-lysidine synthase